MLEHDALFGQVPNLRRLYFEPPEVREVLLQLFGVDDRLFMQSIGVGWLEWASHSEFDAPSFPGTLLWGHTVRAERRELAELGWPKSDLNNFATSISPDGTMAVAVETGDRFTSTISAKRQPRTNSRKGVKTMQMIADNRHLLQASLFDNRKADIQPAPATTGPSRAPLLWIHLIHQSSGDIVSEISLPIVANDRNRIVGWRCRIILPRWRSNNDAIKLRNSAPEAAPDAVVRIVRR